MDANTSNLVEILPRLLRGIDRCVRENTGLWDPGLNAPSPSDHYGHCAAALSLKLGNTGADKRWLLPLDAWMRFDRRALGHAPFNRFLLLLLREAVALDGADVDGLRTIEAAIARCKLPRTYASNNWAVLAQATRVLDPTANNARGVADFCRLVNAWTTHKGGFIDFPRRPRKLLATPIAYHHKVTFVVAVLALHTKDRNLSELLKRLLEWTLMLWDPAGYSGGWGRSNHSLFGDACLLATLVLLHGREELKGMVETISARLAKQFRDDDLLGLTPSDGDSGTRAWDSYMFLSVYNAWAAGILTWASWRVARDSRVHHNILPPNPLIPPVHDEEAGILRLSGEGHNLVFMSTKGQIPQIYGDDAVDLRYAGGLPFHGQLSDNLSFMPGQLIAADGIRKDPAQAGWTPIFQCDGRLFGMTNFDDAQISQSHPGSVILSMSGAPVELTPPPVSGLWRKLGEAIDWRFLGGRLRRTRALRRMKLPVRCTVRWELNLAASHCTHEVSIFSQSYAQIWYLNPRGCSRMPFSFSPLELHAASRVSTARGEGLAHSDAPLRVDRGLTVHATHFSVRQTRGPACERAQLESQRLAAQLPHTLQ